MADDFDWDAEVSNYRRVDQEEEYSEEEEDIELPPPVPAPTTHNAALPPPPKRLPPLHTTSPSSSVLSPTANPSPLHSTSSASSSVSSPAFSPSTSMASSPPPLSPLAMPRTPSAAMELKMKSEADRKEDDDEDDDLDRNQFDLNSPNPTKDWVEYTNADGQKLYYNTQTGKAALNAIPVGEEEFEEDDEAEDKDKQKQKEDTPLSVNAMVTSMTLIQKQLEMLVEQAEILVSPEICDALKEVQNKSTEIQSQLEAVVESAVDQRGDVEALLEWNKVRWNFDNSHVHYYRACAARVNHSVYEYKDWHMPEYLSNKPLPGEIKMLVCTVRLPTHTTTDDANTNTNTITSTKISIGENDTAAKTLQNILTKCKHAFEAGVEYVLKASGFSDYFYGDKLMFGYDYVRSCLRENSELKLSVVRKPTPQPFEGKDLLAEYMAKVDPAIQPISLESYRAPMPSQWSDITYVPMSELALPFRFRINGLDNVTAEGFPRLNSDITHIYIKSFLFYGVQYIPDSTKSTACLPLSSHPRWMTWGLQDYSKDTMLNSLPRGARLGFYVYGRSEVDKDKKDVMLGWVVRQLVDEKGHLVSGDVGLRLWGLPAKEKGKHGKKRELDPNFVFRATNRDNNSSVQPVVLRLKFDEFVVPVVAPLTDKYKEPVPAQVGLELNPKDLHKSQVQKLKDIQDSDPLYVLAPDDKLLLWTARHQMVKYPQVLPKFLQCVQWGKPDHKFEAHRLLHLWAKPASPAAALELLDAKYPDYVVREYAVNLLNTMRDDELALYLLQLVQCLKFEPYHDSPLARFLVTRALKSPFEIGQSLFWHLKSELHNVHFTERFSLVLEEFLSNCPRFAQNMRKQNNAVLKLQRIAELIVKLKREHGYSDEEAMKEYRKELVKLNKYLFGPMGKFQIPLNPRWEATSLIIEKCRYMSSKMVPLWLVFKNSDEDAPPFYVIFKSGDDLRQDILTLQLLQIMDKTWLSNSLDMRLKPYNCVATGVNDHGEGVGMIEVVLNSDTTSGIQLKYGGGAMGALRLDPIDLFLKEHNKTPKEYDRAVENFVRSCAGYCVATFVLGIGDRHNGNIMVTKDGHLFHIDFGHFLGNFKKKFGVNRERAAFVFTPEMAFVMGGKNYKKSEHFKKFLELCFKSFNTLRQNAGIFETLFLQMVAAGMPELMVESDIYYMRDKFYLDATEKKAKKRLDQEIDKSLDSTYRRIDNMIHNFVHG